MHEESSCRKLASAGSWALKKLLFSPSGAPSWEAPVLNRCARCRKVTAKQGRAHLRLFAKGVTGQNG